MAALSQQESRKRYSWWWDSHISPKNSRWLQENLTGMDSKVKQMIKLIEEDADSFARRAEMYYKRRPELMRLVEEFYRAYRALAERYDHATGVIRHAHKTMVEAFPDQDPSMMTDEFFEPDELQKDALGLSSPDLPVTKRKGLKQIDFFEKGTARKSLNFNEAREKERNLHNGSNHNANNVGFNDSKHSVSKHEADISVLKEALAKLEAEKEAGLLNYQNSLERLSSLEKEIRLAQEDSDKLAERAIKAEAEVELLNGALIELKAEKELVLLQYQQCLNKISILEEQISRYEEDTKETSDQAKRAESEVQLLKRDLAVLQAEKEAISAQHKQCLETITDVETKLQQAEESVRRANERVSVAESRVENLNLDIIKLTEENKAFSVQCQQYLERISSLEFQILFSQEEVQRLNEEISNGVVKLKDAEEQCLSIASSHLSLQSDLESLIRKMESKNKELTEKQVELNRLWTCVQEERSRFVEAETAFQTLQLLHNESQEELTALASELQNRAQTVLDLEERNHCLREEVLKIKEENKTLNEINLSSAVSLENMQDEISSLRATIVKLHEEIQVRVNERNFLQQEIYCLRDEFSELKLKHGALLEQMESLELDPDSFGSYVTDLRDNSSMLNDAYQREKCEKVALLEKLEIMARLVEKNAVLENSIADLNAELLHVKDKMKTLEETCHLLVEERSAIVAEKNALHTQILVLTENSGALSEKNVSLESSLADANTELEVLKEKSRRLEDSLLLIGTEKTGLLNESKTLSSQLKLMKNRLEDTEIKCEDLELKNFNLEILKQLLICSIDELKTLEETCHLLVEERSTIVTEKNALHTQIQVLTENSGALSEKNISLESSLADANTELEVLKEKSRRLEDSLLLIDIEKTELLNESKTLSVQLKVTKHRLEDAEIKCEELEDKNFDSEIEKQLLFCSIGELYDSLNSAKQENSDAVRFYQSQLASLECQLHQSQEETQETKNLYSDELDTSLRAEIENSILYNSLQELHKDNTSVGRKCLELFEASQDSEKLISALEQKNADQEVESKALLDELENLRAGFYQMSKTLDFDEGIRPGSMSEDIPFSNKPHSNQILETAEDIKKALTTTLDDNRQLLLEKSILITLLQQLRLEAVNLDAEKCILFQSLKASTQKLSSEIHALKETNEGLEQKCLELFEASQASEKLISALEQKNADWEVESKALLDELEKLRAGFYQMSKTLDFDEGIRPGSMSEDITSSNKPHSNQILETAEDIKKALTTTLDENRQLLLEKSVLITLLQQLQLEAVNLDAEKCILFQNLKASTERLLKLSSEIQVLKETNEGLERNCLELAEASQASEKLISALEQKNADQEVESKALLNLLEKLGAGFYQMSKTLDFDKDIRPGCMYEDTPSSDKPHSNQILETAEDIKKALITTLDKNQQILLENSVIITLLRQLRLEAVDLDAEKCILSQNLEASAQRLLDLSTEVHVLIETNAGLRRTVEEGDCSEKLLRNNIKELNLNLLDVQGSYQNLLQAHNLVLEEKKSLMKELSDVKGANFALEEEIEDILGEAVSLNNIFLVFQDFFSDKSMEAKKIEGSICELHHTKDTLEEIIKKLEEKLQIMSEDKSSLLESLEESDLELKTLRSINSQLKDEASYGKELLHQKEMDLSEVNMKFKTLQNEQTKLQSTIEDLKGEYENEKAIKEEQTEQIFKLAKENGMKTSENDHLRESKHSLETELLELIKKHENVKTRELLYEKEYEELFREQQISAILEACYHEKFQELCEKFENTVSEISSMNSEARLLKERIMALEAENAGLKAHFEEYDSAIKLTSNSVASLENRVIFHEKLSKISVIKEAGMKQDPSQEEISNAILTTGCTELKNLQSRIKAVELAVDDIQKLASEGSLGSSVRVQASLVHREDLESGRSFRRERARRQRYHNSNTSSEITELPKDIMLDQVSDCSSYGPSKRETMAADSQMLESWGTANNDSSLNFCDAKAQKPSHGKKTSSSEIMAEKEMTVVDKLEISERSKDTQQTGKKVKILERLHFDAEKLANLQKTVQDLKRKVGIAERNKKTKGVIEYDTVKEQLEEAEEAIEKLFGVNGKLTKTVEDDSLSSKYESGSDESSTVRRRRVLEQIRRASEKISRLHFEVQKLQFLLLKLEGEKEVTVKTKVIPRSPRVRLRDYLYGGSRHVFARKQKRKFCGCVLPSTKGD